MEVVTNYFKLLHHHYLEQVIKSQRNTERTVSHLGKEVENSCFNNFTGMISDTMLSLRFNHNNVLTFVLMEFHFATKYSL
jgi:hypothetical protein